MLSRTHFVISLLFLMIFVPSVSHPVIFSVFLVFSSLIPDIDSPSSFLGKNKFFSPVQSIVPHRGVLHSLTLAFLLSIILSLFLPSVVWSDTQTTGSMKLLQPSTNTVDKSRSWADKLNVNFQIIDSTVTNSLNRSATINIYDNNGNYLGTATTIKFNSNLSASISGSTVTVNSSGGGGSGSSAYFKCIVTGKQRN